MKSDGQRAGMVKQKKTTREKTVIGVSLNGRFSKDVIATSRSFCPITRESLDKPFKFSDIGSNDTSKKREEARKSLKERLQTLRENANHGQARYDNPAVKASGIEPINIFAASVKWKPSDAACIRSSSSPRVAVCAKSAKFFRKPYTLTPVIKDGFSVPDVGTIDFHIKPITTRKPDTPIRIKSASVDFGERDIKVDKSFYPQNISVEGVTVPFEIEKRIPVQVVRIATPNVSFEYRPSIDLSNMDSVLHTIRPSIKQVKPFVAPKITQPTSNIGTVITPKNVAFNGITAPEIVVSSETPASRTAVFSSPKLSAQYAYKNTAASSLRGSFENIGLKNININGVVPFSIPTLGRIEKVEFNPEITREKSGCSIGLTRTRSAPYSAPDITPCHTIKCVVLSGGSVDFEVPSVVSENGYLEAIRCTSIGWLKSETHFDADVQLPDMNFHIPVPTYINELFADIDGSFEPTHYNQLTKEEIYRNSCDFGDIDIAPALMIDIPDYSNVPIPSFSVKKTNKPKWDLAVVCDNAFDIVIADLQKLVLEI